MGTGWYCSNEGRGIEGKRERGTEGWIGFVDVVWAGFGLNPHPLKTEGAAPKSAAV